MKIKVIACNVLFREISNWAARSPHTIDVDFLTRELHNEPDDLRSTVQRSVDAAQGQGYDAVVLGYGLCSNGAAYVVARDTPLVLPRAHDCITFFLGSRTRYDEFFSRDPGTYYYTSGWIERAGTRVERTTPEGQANYEQTYQGYVDRFGEESAQYLMETLHSWWKSYTRACFIKMDLPDADRFEANAREQTRQVAAEYGWEYAEVPGGHELFRELVNGPWSSADFLTVLPGQQIVPSYDDGVLAATTDHQPIPPRAPRDHKLGSLGM